MFLGLIGGLAQAFNGFGAKGKHTGGSVGINSNTHVDQTFKGKIKQHSRLPQKVSHAQVEQLAKQAKEAKENAKNLREYRKYLEMLVTAYKDSYSETAAYKVFFEKIKAEIAKIDAVTNEGISQFGHKGNLARAELAGYQSACESGAAFRPFG